MTDHMINKMAAGKLLFLVAGYVALSVGFKPLYDDDNNEVRQKLSSSHWVNTLYDVFLIFNPDLFCELLTNTMIVSEKSAVSTIYFGSTTQHRSQITEDPLESVNLMDCKKNV